MKDTADLAAKEEIRKIMTEARIVRQLNHPNLIKCYGVAAIVEPLMIVFELVNITFFMCASDLLFLGGARRSYYLHTTKSYHKSNKIGLNNRCCSRYRVRAQERMDSSRYRVKELPLQWWQSMFQNKLTKLINIFTRLNSRISALPDRDLCSSVRC